MNLVEMLSEYESNFDGGETEVMGAPTGICLLYTSDAADE